MKVDGKTAEAETGGGGVRLQDERGGIEGRMVGRGAARMKGNRGRLKREQKRLTVVTVAAERV